MRRRGPPGGDNEKSGMNAPPGATKTSRGTSNEVAEGLRTPWESKAAAPRLCCCRACLPHCVCVCVGAPRAPHTQPWEQ
ncbi:hypothetical protein MRX96_029451 [Rhipicephalus microplus]